MVYLEADPREGRRGDHTFGVIVRNARLGSPPSYGGGTTEQPCAPTHHMESKRDDFGTVVTEVTTVTTRRRYRIEGA